MSGPGTACLHEVRRKQSVLGSLSRNPPRLPITIFKTIPGKLYGTAPATVKEAETPSPRAVSSRVGASPQGHRSPRGGTRGPSPAGTPASRAGDPMAMPPARPHSPPVRAGPGPAVPRGEAEKPDWLLLTVSCGSEDLPGGTQNGPEAQGASRTCGLPGSVGAGLDGRGSRAQV